MLPEGGWEGKRGKEGREEEGREPHTQALSGSFPTHREPGYKAKRNTTPDMLSKLPGI